MCNFVAFYFHLGYTLVLGSGILGIIIAGGYCCCTIYLKICLGTLISFEKT